MKKLAVFTGVIIFFVSCGNKRDILAGSWDMQVITTDFSNGESPFMHTFLVERSPMNNRLRFSEGKVTLVTPLDEVLGTGSYEMNTKEKTVDIYFPNDPMTTTYTLVPIGKKHLQLTAGADGTTINLMLTRSDHK